MANSNKIKSPVKFYVDYPEKLSRGILLLKTFFSWLYVLIPHGIILALYGIAVSMIMSVMPIIVLILARFPKELFDFIVSFIRWGVRVAAYEMLLTDAYPPFTGRENVSNSPVKFSIEHPERLSRGSALLKVLFGYIYVALVHGFVLSFYSIALTLALIVGWFVILFTGSLPRKIFDFAVGYFRWCLRVYAYYPYYMTDAYPPFTGKPTQDEMAEQTTIKASEQSEFKQDTGYTE